MYPKEYRFSKTHEYVKVEGNIGYVGLSHYAQEQLGDIVFVELPDIGKKVKKNEVFGVVESVKAVSDCYSPVSGTVVKVNEKLMDSPETVNQDPHGEGWIMAVELADASDLDDLLDGEAYETAPKEHH